MVTNPPSEPVPRWVRNVKYRTETWLGRSAFVGRVGYRLIVSLTVIALYPTLIYCWLVSPSPMILAGRIIFLLIGIVVLPILWLKWFNPPTTVVMFCARRGIAPMQTAPVRVEYAWVNLEKISPAMQLAVLVSEDTHFFWHIGFNPIEIWHAIKYNRTVASNRTLRGGSTISQQVAKNLFLLPIQSLARKMIEAMLTLLIEGLWSKRRIFEMYLNIVQFSDNVFGVQAAARHYFQCSPMALTEEQSTLLAAALRRPQIYLISQPSALVRVIQADIRQRMDWCGEELLTQFDDSCFGNRAGK